MSHFLSPFEPFWVCCLESYPTVFPPCFSPSWVTNENAHISINMFFTGHSSIFKGFPRRYITECSLCKSRGYFGLLETSWSSTSCSSWKQSNQQSHSDRVPRMGEEGLFFEVIWYLNQGITDVYHECWTNASKKFWLQSGVNCPSSTPFTSRPDHVIKPWAWGVMSASWISLHWLRPKFDDEQTRVWLPFQKTVWHCLASDWCRTTGTVKSQNCFYPSYWKC